MTQLPAQTASTAQNIKQQPQPQIIQVSGALGQNAPLGQMMIAQPATNIQQAPVVTTAPKGKGRVIKAEVSFTFYDIVSSGLF